MKPMTAKELAIATGLYLPAVEAWSDTAVSFGFLRRISGKRMSISKTMKSLLIDKTHRDYLGGQFSYLALKSLQYDGFENLFKLGRVTPISSSFEAIEEATHWDHYALLGAIESDPELRQLLRTGCKLADIGCGTGSLIAKLCNAYPKSDYFGIDPSSKACELAKQSLKGEPVRIVRMKAEAMRFLKEFDIVLLGESLYASANKSAVVKNCRRALKDGGTILVLEGLMPENATEDKDLIIAGMQLDFAMHGHKFMKKTELKGLLHHSGFRDLKFVPLGGSVYLAKAKK
jgi:SAM-dependent methyltransferase